MSSCKECEGFIMSDGYHRCPPKWRVLDEDWNSSWEDCEVVYAYDEEEAAEKVADVLDSAQAEGATERILYVRPYSGGKIKKFNITFDYSVDYTASEKEFSEGELGNLKE